MIYYSQTQGTIINITVSICALGMIGLQLCRLKRKFKLIWNQFHIFIVIQFASVLVAFFVNLLIGVIVDALGSSLSWYTNTWLIFGIYFCPTFYIMNIGQSLYLGTEIVKSSPIKHQLLLQLVGHAHCVVLVFWLMLMSILGIRSSFVIMISIFFYAVSLIINWIAKLYKHCKYFGFHIRKDHEAWTPQAA